MSDFDYDEEVTTPHLSESGLDDNDEIIAIDDDGNEYTSTILEELQREEDDTLSNS